MSAAQPLAEPELALAAVLHRALLSAAAGDEGRTLTPVSLALDFGELKGEPLPADVQARIDRATRSLVFVSGEVRDDAGLLLVAGSAVFGVEAEAQTSAAV